MPIDSEYSLPNNELVWSLSPLEYYGLVEVVNLNYLDEWRKEIEELFHDFDFQNTCFVVVGSDGRLEKHIQSRTEIVIFTRERLPIGFQQIKQRLLTASMPVEFGWKDKVDLKDPSKKDLPFSSVYDNPQFIFPDRIINSVLLVGNEELYFEIRRKVIEEIVNNPKIIRVLKKQFRSHRSAMLKGKYRGLVVFDLEGYVQFYDEEEGKWRFGFKSAHLRAFQRFMLMLLSSYIKSKEGEVDFHSLSLEFPLNPIKQYEWFIRKGFLSRTYRDLSGKEIKSEDVIEAYQWFLREYHRVQETYKDQEPPRKGVSVQFNREDFLKHHSCLKAFLYHRSRR